MVDTEGIGTSKLTCPHWSCSVYTECQLYPERAHTGDNMAADDDQRRDTPRIMSSCPPVLLSSCPPVLLSSCPPVLLSSCPPVLPRPAWALAGLQPGLFGGGSARDDVRRRRAREAPPLPPRAAGRLPALWASLGNGRIPRRSPNFHYELLLWCCTCMSPHSG